jgi:SAM-dependent methyltransferase
MTIESERATNPTASSTPAFDAKRYKSTTRDQWQSAAEAWHRWGPLLERWLGAATERMLDMARAGSGARVLDVAAGAGGQSIAAARRVGPRGRVLATDLSPNILDFASKAARAAGLANVETRVVDGEELDVGEGAFDAVVSRLGLIYFPDQQRALAGMRRALRDGGRVAAIVYSTAANNEFFSIPVSIIRRRANLPPPAPGQPGPFSLASGALAAAFERAGFREIETEVVRAPVIMANARECLRFEQESFGALHQMLSGVDEKGRKEAWAEIESALTAFEDEKGFTGPCELVVGAATK